MSLFDACEQFFRQINPQHYCEDEEIELNEENIVIKSDDDYSYCPCAIAASQLVEYVIYIQNYLWEKKQN
jgi:hypothetical protein